MEYSPEAARGRSLQSSRLVKRVGERIMQGRVKTESATQSFAADRRGYFFGVATIDAEGTICLKLLSQEWGSLCAHGYLCFDKAHAEHRNILDQVGPIKVGHEKVIRPFKP
jgi:hypothetical protein